jgi:hypothetical protein
VPPTVAILLVLVVVAMWLPLQLLVHRDCVVLKLLVARLVQLEPGLPALLEPVVLPSLFQERLLEPVLASQLANKIELVSAQLNHLR